MSINIFISVTPILPACFVGAEEMYGALQKPERIFETYRPTCGTSALALKHTSMVSKRALSVATEAYVCELERRAPASGARFSAMFVSLSGVLRPPERASPQPET